MGYFVPSQKKVGVRRVSAFLLDLSSAWTQHQLHPLFHLRPSGTYYLSSVSSIPLLKKAKVFGRKAFLRFLSRPTLCWPNCIPTCPPIMTQSHSQYPLTPPHSTLASAELKNFASVSSTLLYRQCETAYQLVLLSWHNLSLNIR